MDILRLQRTLLNAEGCILVPYQDHLGIWTIGFGTTHWLGRRVTERWKKISLNKAEAMLNSQMIWAVESASNSVSNFQEIGNIRQEALSEIVYQIGASGWLKFKRTRKFIEWENWKMAGPEFLDSKLALDTPSRAQRYAQMIELGENYEHY